MKTSPARWYRNSPPQIDGWSLHCLLGASEPAMAEVVESFRDIILGGPPLTMPDQWSSTPDPLGDFLRGYAFATAGRPLLRSPYLRDRIADMPVFRDRDRPLPMRPKARCSKTTADAMPKHDRGADLASRGLPTFLAAVDPIGSLEVFFDDSLPDGVIEIDGTCVTVNELQAATEDT